MRPVDQQPGHRDLRSFGRRRGRKLSPRQQQLLAELLPQVRVDLSAPNPDSPAAGSPQESRRCPDPSLCGRLPAGESHAAGQTWLEIGFGGGEHLVWQAEHNPDVTLIGCEPFEDGVVKVLTAIADRRLTNISLHPDDARPLLRALPPRSIGRAFILFPDPWPKKRHAKRRLVSAETLSLLTRILRPGAELRIATDIGDYARTTLLAARATPALAWQAAGPADWRIRPADWPATRYGEKALREGRRCYYFTFRRV
jgi:tRNA (guanine-N7-)-methyltransferase